jgi:spermidine/putrescine transport system substrate-binding protein
MAIKKNTIFIAVLVVIAISSLIGILYITQPPTPTIQKLTALVWEDYTVPEVMNPFREKYPNIIVENSIFANQPEMLAKLVGGFKADVVTPCIDFLPRLIDQGLLQPIDYNKLDNWKNLFQSLRQYPEIWRGDKLYMVPESFGVEAGITYRTDKVDPIKNWKDIFDPKYAKRVIIINDPRLGIVIGAWALGYTDVWNLKSEDLQRIKQFYLENKASILKFYTSDIEARGLLASGDAWILAGSGPAQAYWLRSQGIDAKFVLPDGIGIGWLCGISILKGTQQIEAVHKYIDYLISEAPQYYFATEWLYGPTNQEVFKRLPPEKIEESGMIGPEVLSRLVPLTDPENLDEWLKVWEEIRSSI